MADFLDPLAYIRQYEASNDYNVLYGGGSLVGLPVNQYGFPQWAGKDNSHAAGGYQFEPATWEIYASRLGISDFSPRSQDAIAAAVYAARGFADWAPYNPKLANAIKLAGGIAAFSLGAAWLAMSSAPGAPAPVDGLVLKDGDVVTGKDDTGKSFSLAVKIGMVIIAMAMGGAAIKTMLPAPTEAAQVTLRFEYQPAWQAVRWERIP